ncbi:DUF4360 domain-containing protein [Streptomyces sp. NBC_00237]|uniref:DUF4360 domain-containing protein n=1 Tax=Streptomyces sp. NBC_00237 TaxID=2975687 RepID=UPI002256152C|nr:DUF4360 domain-containing protein [Streptomyces sp. NBC_00237]MCX5199958.1 DUF4360 domain-containing protein [Streptomyces sp. NBC_00237]
MLKAALIGAAAALTAAASLPSASSAPAELPAAPAAKLSAAPKDRVTIKVAQVNGSGCRPGTASVAVSPDNTAFTVTYSEYLAQVGQGAKFIDSRKNCQLGLKVNIPQGYTYAVAKADHRGFADLAQGAYGTQKSSFYFQGMSDTDRRTHQVRGPYQGNWQVTDRTGIEALVFAPCGAQRNFNINTELVVNKGQSDPSRTSFMTMDSTDGSFNTKYHFAWKKCPVS